MTKSFVAGLVVGTAFMAVGVAMALGEWNRVQPAELARFTIGAALVHDLVVVPVVLVVTAGLARSARRWPRAATASGLALAAMAVVAAATLPTWAAYGRRPDNPSLLPLDYTRGLVAVAAVVAMVAVAAGLVWSRRGGRADRDR